jgi:basic membrane protein A
MRRRLTVAAAALAVAGAIAAPARSAEKVKVGLVFDVGGLGDKSFNDAAHRGLVRAQKELGAEVQYVEPGEGSERENALRRLAGKGYDLIFGVGFMFTDDVTAMAAKFPKVKWACVDYATREGQTIPDNLVALKFKEEEGCYLVGALAALTTKSGKLGFVGGMDIPLIHKFEAGYKAGAKAARPDVEVLVGYAGSTGDAFKNPTKGKELGLSQIQSGADVIFHASGSTGLGVFEACKQEHKLAIGVDSDQWDASMPDTILTSMVKRVDVAVFETIKDRSEGKFTGGVRELGLREDGVGYVYDEHNKKLIPDDVRAKIEAYRKDIIEGRIKVPSTR